MKQSRSPKGTSRKARRTWGPPKLGKTAARLIRRPTVQAAGRNGRGYFTLEDLRREQALRDEWRKAHRARNWLVERCYSLDRWASSVLHLTWYRKTRTFITRGRKGWAPPDVWSLDDYLCRVIGDQLAWAAGLISDTVPELDRTCHGHPCDMTAGQWRDILNDISIPLRMYKTHWEESYRENRSHQENNAAEQRVIDEAAAAFRLLADHLPSLWD